MFYVVSHLVITNINALRSEVCSGNLNLLHKLRMRSRHIVEGEDSVAELEEKVCAEGDECPEWELHGIFVSFRSRRCRAHTRMCVWWLREYVVRVHQVVKWWLQPRGKPCRGWARVLDLGWQ